MYNIGIDLGGTNIATGLVAGDGTLLHKSKTRTLPERGYEAVVRDMAATVADVLRKAGISPREVERIGVGTPGAVDSKRRIVLKAGNLGFIMTPLGDELQKYFDAPVTVNNDANCAAYGEAVAGAAKGFGDVIMFTLGTGIGGGIIIGGRVFEGFNGTAGEVGHFILVADGLQCTCGNRGCFEQYASATALVRLTREAMERERGSAMWRLCGGDINAASGRTAFEAQRAGDAAGAAVVERYISYLGQGIASFFNVLQPECVIIGGGVSGEGEALLSPLRDKVYSMVFGGAYHPVGSIVQATLGNDAGIIGAAMI